MDKETIWGSSYEESAESIQQSTNQTSSIDVTNKSQDQNSTTLKKYNLRNNRSIIQAPTEVKQPKVKKLNVFKGIETKKSVDMNISTVQPVVKKSTRSTRHFIDENVDLDVSQKVLTAIDKKKQRKTINFINGEEIAEEIDKNNKQEMEIAQPPNKITKMDQSYSFLLHEEVDVDYTFIDSNEFDYTRQSFVNRKSDSSFLPRNQSQTENSLRKSVILKSPKKSTGLDSVADMSLEASPLVAESDKGKQF